ARPRSVRPGRGRHLRQFLRADAVPGVQPLHPAVPRRVEQHPAGDHAAPGRVLDAQPARAVAAHPVGGVAVVERVAGPHVAERVHVRGGAVRGEHQRVVGGPQPGADGAGTGRVVAAVDRHKVLRQRPPRHVRHARRGRPRGRPLDRQGQAEHPAGARRPQRGEHPLRGEQVQRAELVAVPPAAPVVRRFGHGRPPVRPCIVPAAREGGRVRCLASGPGARAGGAGGGWSTGAEAAAVRPEKGVAQVRSAAQGGEAVPEGAAEVQGTCAPEFSRVRKVFENNFARGLETGAAITVHIGDEKVVELWGGLADHRTGRRWERDTPCFAFSCTKALTAAAALRTAARGGHGLGAPVASWWPGFDAAGKAGVTGEHLLAHQAGLPAFARPVAAEEAADPAAMAELLAGQAPEWEPGTAHGYHTFTYGWLAGEIVRRLDGRTVGGYVADEIAGPLGLDLWVGAPDPVLDRTARLTSSKADADRGGAAAGAPPAGD